MNSQSVSQDLPLVDDDMPNHVVRQMSQESVRSAGPTLVCDKPTSSQLPVSVAQHPVQRSGSHARLDLGSKRDFTHRRPSSRGSPTSVIGSSASSKPQRLLKLSSQNGKGKPLSGASSTSKK